MNKQSVHRKTLAHERLAGQFDQLMNEYDVNRRLEILIDEFLQGIDLEGKLVLDAGCGTGRGTQRLAEKGATVIALDIGQELVRFASSRCRCEPTLANVLHIPFRNDVFDVVFSTEVIEHTPDPLNGALEMNRVLKPGGHLILSTPNRLWQTPVRLGSALRMRPYDGYENFIKPAALRKALERDGSRVIEHRGLHLLPFQLSFAQSTNRRIDRFGRLLLPIMINQCLHCIKQN